MTSSESAGQPATGASLIDFGRVLDAYYTQHPDPAEPEHRISFGTSGHRGQSMAYSFNDDHILAITQAICDVRRAKGIDGPLFLGMDTHALSQPAHVSALEVLAGNGVAVRYQQDAGYTPTPVISRAILRHNDARITGPGLADGIVVTPSHNPPEFGGFKYNPPHGGQASIETTRVIEDRANTILADGLGAVKRIPIERASRLDEILALDLAAPYITELDRAIDFEPIATSGLALGVDPMGGASVGYWEAIAEHYRLDIEVVNPRVDPTFAFVSVDHDGKLRMDPSSADTMAGLVGLKDRFDVAWGNDPDVDRFGIVTASHGLLPPNHYLAVAADYLFRHRPDWPAKASLAKTVVSSSMIDRVAARLERPLVELPVGFKWFAEGLRQSVYGFAGEESAGASFLCRDGSVWTTDKDGLLLGLLAAEITARTGRDPGERYADLESHLGRFTFSRLDIPASREERIVLGKLSPDQVETELLAGDPILALVWDAPGNGAAIGGLKIISQHGWFLARPSGTEDLYKIYAETTEGADHLERIIADARQIISGALRSASTGIG